MAYFDLQVNGYGGVDFNQDDLTADDLHKACARIEADGVGGFLATIITEDLSKMCARLSRLAELREKDPLAQKLITGFHIEGPFISDVDGYRGAHPKDAVRPANVDDAKRMLDAAQDLTKIITLSPECDANFATIKFLATQNVTVSAGHCNPTLDQLKGAIDAGLSMFTHLGNGCPMQMHRHDNIIQRALSLSDRLWLCFIADGVHVPFVALGNYLRAATIDRCIVVTDAIAPASLGPGRYKLARWDLLIGEDMVARAPDGSHFVGAAITMKQSERNLREKLHLNDAQLQTLLVDNPRRAIGLPF
jgi:N-acetylglucosamine-6-phosphate deacetylase